MRGFKVLVIIFLACPYLLKGQNFLIHSELKNMPDGVQFFLIKNKNGTADTTQRTISRNNRFEFMGTLRSEGELVYVKMDTSIYKIENKESYTKIILDTGIIVLRGAFEDWPNISMNEFNSTGLFNYMESRAIRFDSIVKKLKRVKDTINLKREISLYNNLFDSIFYHYPNSTATASMLYFFKRGVVSEVHQKELFDKLTERSKNSFYAKIWERDMKLSVISNSIRLEGTLPNFRFKNINDSIINSMDVINKNRYTLIDLWASWCRPCKEEIPNIIKVYKKYKDRGFNVLAIGVMDSERNWRKALEYDGSSWIHGFDASNEVKTLFGLNSLPAYILVDKSGKLIAYQCLMSSIKSFGGNIRGDDLDERIKSLTE